MEGIVLDGVTYRVRVVYPSLRRKFELVSGPNAGSSISDRKIRDLVGTAYSYSMQLERDPRHPEDFDALYDSISAPVDSHEVTLPYGQTVITFEAAVTTGEDVDQGVQGGYRKWGGLTVNFDPMEPQRVPT